ncbi:inorganic phosphate transporter [Ekhidna sp.]|uniref:inorganic phosphate transporter n=1 Tax=Ekhidna sp. TaxID=2608089 RepID=UPI0032991004
MILLVLFIAACLLAYANGANDNFKGVATLFGSGTTNYKKAINWATITTLLGSVSAFFLAGELVKNFSGKGLVPDLLIQSPEFAISIALGAGLTVLLATKIGMPISTTHSLVGALLGSGLVAVGSSFNFAKLGGTFLFPLMISPLMAAIVSLIGYVIFRQLRLMSGITKDTTIELGDEIVQTTAAVALTEGSSQNLSSAVIHQSMMEKYNGRLLGISAQKLLDFAHYLSAGIVSFARGLNDTPKIAGLLLFIHVLDIRVSLISIGLMMAIGGLINAKRVGHTVSKKITRMNHGQGFTANLFTGILVTTASIHGMPVSTTHVSVGSIFGIGMVTKKADTRVIRNILLSWLLTLPVAALCSALVYLVIINLY